MKLKTGFVCAVRDSCDVTLADWFARKIIGVGAGVRQRKRSSESFHFLSRFESQLASRIIGIVKNEINRRLELKSLLMIEEMESLAQQIAFREEEGELDED
jgi:hypothetical protein